MGFVSVITPTYKRHEHIPVVVEMFNKQDYPHNKMELIIYDDSPTPMNFPPRQSNIKYVYTSERISLQQKRNALNSMAEGDIIVSFDDDDYYPPTRVSHAVESLYETGKHIAGSTKIYLANVITGQAIIVGPFHNNHATNNTFAYTAEYVRNNSYDENEAKNISEERAFTKNFTNPMAQLNPENTIVCLHHGTNTVDKEIFFKNARSIGTLENVVPDDSIRKQFISLHTKRSFPRVIASLVTSKNKTHLAQKVIESLTLQTYEQLHEILVSCPSDVTIGPFDDNRVRMKYVTNNADIKKWTSPIEDYSDEDDKWLFIVDDRFELQKEHLSVMVQEAYKRFRPMESLYGLSGANERFEMPPESEADVLYLHGFGSILAHRSMFSRNDFLNYVNQTNAIEGDSIVASYCNHKCTMVNPHHTLSLFSWISTELNYLNNTSLEETHSL